MILYMVYAKFPYYLKYWIDEVLEIFTDPTFACTDEDENYVGIYGWTIKKDIIAEFKKGRTKDYFIYKTKKISKKEFKDFKNVYDLCEIKREYFGKSDLVTSSGKTIACTVTEYRTITEPERFLLFWNEMMGYVSEDYYWFNDELLQAVDLIGYTTEYDIMFGGDDRSFLDEEIEQRIENAAYSMSYNLTVDGNTYIPIISNQVEVFLRIYEPTFLGEKSLLVQKWKRGKV